MAKEIVDRQDVDDLYTGCERRRHLHKINPQLANICDMAMATLVRIVFLLQGIFCIYFLVASTRNYFFLFMIIFLIVICIDGFYVVLRRKGQEWFWFSISSLSYIFLLLITIWKIVLIKYASEDYDCSENITLNDGDQHLFYGTIELCELLEIFVDVFILTCILSRWVFPMKTKFRREALLSLLLSFITNGTDIIEFFTYVDEERIFSNRAIIIVILSFFSISTVQFSLTLSAKLERSSYQNFIISKIVLETVFCTELWALVIVFFTQDFPFLVIRTYVIIWYGAEKNYLLYFFVVKNYLLCFFEIYMSVNIVLDERHMKKNERKNVMLTEL